MEEYIKELKENQIRVKDDKPAYMEYRIEKEHGATYLYVDFHDLIWNEEQENVIDWSIPICKGIRIETLPRFIELLQRIKGI